MEVDGATSISTILLVDVDVESFPPYKYVSTIDQNTPKLCNENL
jgi:hypothetical protein